MSAKRSLQKVEVPPLGGCTGVAIEARPPKGGTPAPENRPTHCPRSTWSRGSRDHSHQRRAAFTLVEVLIAVAIFAMTSSVLMSAFVNALLARESAANYDLLNADIRAVRMQLLLEPNLEDAEDGDEYETLNCGEASWQAQITPTNVVDLFQVQFNIRFSQPPEGLPADYSEMLYLLRPTWSESDERSELLQDKREALQDSRGGF
ncbi:type II secretion system protein [Coraliomargarita algicola]|uniref:Type II secretion system protein n=1 Tax=Coraliomargarita algicola TaxID=3092156 RepID=A0ABZ0RGL8_9BACT|nr:type II secretion system protein [Coraliomargarita sp. J2-16]WPJ94668.1 type II secretion system protein [Coraliomargarita sp. J2-16]